MKIKNLLLSLFWWLIILWFSSFCSATDYFSDWTTCNTYCSVPHKKVQLYCSWTTTQWVYIECGSNRTRVWCTPIGSTPDYTIFDWTECTTLTFQASSSKPWFYREYAPECQTCSPQYTSEECQTEYWLVSSWVLNSCQSDLTSCQSSLSGWDNSLNNCSNNLLSCQSSLSSCIAWNCPLDDWDVQWSSLFINNIQHIWAPLININIPEEISWDYTSSTGSFDLDVEGYNVDADYIEWVINIQNSKPTTEDFNKIITQVIPLFVPWLVIILFIYFVFKFIKKIF